MSELLDLSARYIDENVYEGPRSVNRPTGELAVLADDIAFIEAFSHVVVFSTDAGLILFDTSLEAFGEVCIKALRGWTDRPVHTMAYTHGHIDHVGGSAAFVAEAKDRGDARPRVLGHENVAPRFHRYETTNGYNQVINTRQFGRGKFAGLGGKFGPGQWIFPDTTFDTTLNTRIGDLDIELRHARGETDDHLWAWIPKHRAVVAGDFVIWMFPNAGNPQKVQRYPLEWAKALREMIALKPELLLPAHGLPVAGEARIRGMLDGMATALESLVEQTLAMMNGGATLNEIIHTVKVPDELMGRPYLQPNYDEPEFVVHNIWRLYGGWYDGNPANLKPASEVALAKELASLAGGAQKLAERASALVGDGQLRLACHLAELSVQAEPDNRAAHGIRGEVYRARREAESSLMAKGIYRTAAENSEEKA